MHPSQISLKVIEGQQVLINMESGVIILEIDEPFMKAGKLLNWDLSVYGSPGFGINKSIINLVLNHKFKMLIRHDTGTQKEFWLNHDNLKNFLINHNTEYKVKSKWINVIPWKLFHSKPNFSGASC